MTGDPFLAKAKSLLGAARLLLDNGFTDEAASRPHRATFDAVRMPGPPEEAFDPEVNGPGVALQTCGRPLNRLQCASLSLTA